MPSFTRRVRPGVTTSSGGAGGQSSSGAAPENSAGPSTPASTSTAPAGTKPYPSAPTRFVSSGIASLDDVLGGGLPLGSVMTLLAPDVHTQWARLVARHAAAQGVLDGQRVVILAPDEVARDWVRGMPWVEGESGAGTSKGTGAGAGAPTAGDESDAEPEDDNPSRTKIAWRYDRLARVRTTVGGYLGRNWWKGGSSALAANTTLPPDIRAELERTGGITYVDPGTGVESALGALAEALGGTDSGATRVIVPDLGGPDWPETSRPQLVRFLYALRALLRGRAAVGVVTLPPGLSEDEVGVKDVEGTSGASAWIAAVAHASDASFTLQGFGASPGHFRAFHPLHGLLTPHTLPSSHHVLAPALRHSTLLGVRDGGEQNLGFRLRRKRWVVESVHLGIEGGTSERRTEPPAPPPASNPAIRMHEPTEGIDRPSDATSASVSAPLPASPAPNPDTTTTAAKPKKPRARVRFGEDVEDPPPSAQHHGHTHAPGHAHAPRVEIRHDRPDLYEF